MVGGENKNMHHNWPNPWPGRGPYAHLPPWQRPGWLYGRAACCGHWATYKDYPPIPTLLKPEDEIAILTQQKTFVEEQLKTMQENLQKIQERIDKLKTQP